MMEFTFGRWIPDSMIEVERRLRRIVIGLRTRAFFDIQINKIDGTTLDVAVSNASIKYKGKNAIQTVFYDISKTKKVQEELRKSEEVYRNIFSHSPLGILHFDANSEITDCNEEFAKLIGAPRKALIGLNMITDLKDKKLINAVKKSLSEGSSIYEDYYTSVTSGYTLPVTVRFNAIYSDNKSIIGGVGLVEDISERKNSEKLQKALFDISEEAGRTTSMKELYVSLHRIIKTLMPAENFYVSIYNQVSNIISFPYHCDQYDKQPDKREFQNGLTEYILRTKRSNIIDSEAYQKLIESGEVEPRGKRTEVYVGIYLEFEGNYRGVLALKDYDNPKTYSEEDMKVLQFVSAQIIKVLDKKYADRRLRESVKELSEAKRELEIINKNKDRFFSIIAHDLRSPFNTLLGVSEMISGDMDDMSMREVKEISNVIHSSTQNLFKLIENLLSWSRLQMDYKFCFRNS